MQRCLQRLPQVDVRRIDCHHWPLTERPAEVRQAIEDCCARVALGPAHRARLRPQAPQPSTTIAVSESERYKAHKISRGRCSVT
jgi:hypothetical protein